MWFYFVCFLAYSSLSGIKDAILYSHNTHKPFGFNEHQIWVAERAFVLMIILGNIYIELTIIEYIRVAISCILGFSFIHNGYYYETRKRLGKTDYHWFSNSSSTTAKVSFNWFTRTLMYAIAIVNLIY